MQAVFESERTGRDSDAANSVKVAVTAVTDHWSTSGQAPASAQAAPLDHIFTAYGSFGALDPADSDADVNVYMPPGERSVAMVSLTRTR